MPAGYRPGALCTRCRAVVQPALALVDVVAAAGTGVVEVPELPEPPSELEELDEPEVVDGVEGVDGVEVVDGVDDEPSVDGLVVDDEPDPPRLSVL